MTTKTITIAAAIATPGILQKKEGGVPLGWLPGIMKDVKRELGVDDDQQIFVHNFDGVSFSTTRQMTEMEVLQEQLEAERAAKKKMLANVPASGDGSVTFTYAELRELFK